MTQGWPAVSYDRWAATCDTLHAHTQVLGKLAAKLAPPEPQLQHAALRLTARGWETAPLPAPDGSGALVVALDLHLHEAVVEHSGGRVERIALTPDRAVGEVTREVLAAVRAVGGDVTIDPTPQEVPWDTPLDADEVHAHYDPGEVADYFAAATQAALVLAEFRASYRGRKTPVNAWWGSFDLAVSLFSGLPAVPPSDEFIPTVKTSRRLHQVTVLDQHDHIRRTGKRALPPPATARSNSAGSGPSRPASAACRAVGSLPGRGSRLGRHVPLDGRGSGTARKQSP
jgi:hypothetical protein